VHHPFANGASAESLKMHRQGNWSMRLLSTGILVRLLSPRLWGSVSCWAVQPWVGVFMVSCWVEMPRGHCGSIVSCWDVLERRVVELFNVSCWDVLERRVVELFNVFCWDVLGRRVVILFNVSCWVEMPRGHCGSIVSCWDVLERRVVELFNVSCWDVLERRVVELFNVSCWDVLGRRVVILFNVSCWDVLERRVDNMQHSLRRRQEGWYRGMRRRQRGAARRVLGNLHSRVRLHLHRGRLEQCGHVPIALRRRKAGVR
jgi:hypothetical protein